MKKNRPDLNVKVHLEYVDPKFGIIENINDIDLSDPDDTEYDLFIALDTASVDRLGKHAKYFENAKKTFCIDHHKSNLGYADENIEKIEVEDEMTDEICEKCGRNMVKKRGRFGEFLACSGYPECKYTENLRR